MPNQLLNTLKRRCRHCHCRRLIDLSCHGHKNTATTGTVNLLVDNDDLEGQQPLSLLRDLTANCSLSDKSPSGRYMTTIDELDQLAAAHFDGYLVKDLAQQFKGQYPVPTYVGEFLLGKYCATTDPDEIAEGLEIVQRNMAQRTVRAGEQELFKMRAQQDGRVKIIDLIRAKLNAAENRYEAELPSLQLNTIHIADNLVVENDRMLTGGFFAEVTLEYITALASEKGGMPFRVESIRPIQMSSSNALQKYRAARTAFTLDQWRELLLRSVGFEPTQLNRREQDMLILRMVPFAVNNYNAVELGPRGTGKSHLFQQVSPYAHLVSGGKATIANMFVNNRTGQPVSSPSTTSFVSTKSPASPSIKRRRQHAEGLHGVRRVLPRQREHQSRGRHRHGRQLRC